MYIPAHFKAKDPERIKAFIKSYPFGLLVSSAGNRPIATHLPFVLNASAANWTLRSHMALANPQWKDMEGKEVLLVFSEPHAYISPSHYEQKENVPTWNYLAVHIYGSFKILNDKAQKIHLMEEMIESFEPTFLEQWHNLGEQYKSKMLNEIAAFEIEATDIQGKEKLSQNKSEQERQRIIDSLIKSGRSEAGELANYMKARKPK